MIRVRFAPSPTGYLHLGGARTALFNWLFARSQGGKLILRIEDSDLERYIPDSEAKLIQDMKWLGLDWDEGPDVGGPHQPYRQSERLDLYQKYADQLSELGLTYKCYCKPEELEEKRKQDLAEGRTPVYEGTCRHLTPEQEAEFLAQGRKPALRFKVPDRKMIVHDLVKGDVEFDTSLIGDFVIIKSNGTPSYNFAVVIDDYTMEISHIIRGDEHLINTPRQILIYEALGWELPQFAHLGMILSKDRQKLSKRHGTTALGEFREKGYNPDGLLNYIALLGWSPIDEQEILSHQDLFKQFNLTRLSKSPAVFDMGKLNWMSGQYIKKMALDDLVHLIQPQFEAAKLTISPEKLRQIAHIMQEKILFGEEIIKESESLLNAPEEFGPEAKEILSQESAKTVLNSLKEKLAGFNHGGYDAAGFTGLLGEVKNETKLGGKSLYMPVRVALTGQVHGPDLPQIAEILGQDECLKRLSRIIQ